MTDIAPAAPEQPTLERHSADLARLLLAVLVGAETVAFAFSQEPTARGVWLPTLPCWIALGRLGCSGDA